MKTAIMSIIFFCLTSVANGQTVEPMWTVKPQASPILIRQEAFDSQVIAETGSLDIAYNISIETTNPFSLLGDDVHKPGFGMSTCIDSLQVIENIVETRSMTIATLLDIGVCTHYTIIW